MQRAQPKCVYCSWDGPRWCSTGTPCGRRAPTFVARPHAATSTSLAHTVPRNTAPRKPPRAPRLCAVFSVRCRNAIARLHPQSTEHLPDRNKRQPPGQFQALAPRSEHAVGSPAAIASTSVSVRFRSSDANTNRFGTCQQCRKLVSCWARTPSVRTNSRCGSIF